MKLEKSREQRPFQAQRGKTPPPPRYAAAYCRVSTAEQAQNGHSLETQQERLNAYATATGNAITRSFIDDGYSAGTVKRPSLQELLVEMKAGRIECVYVTKLDRLSRSLIDLLEIVRLCERRQIALVSASESINTGTPAGRMMLQLLGVFAEFERGRIGERISEVLADRRFKRHVYNRNIPFGYRRVGNALEIDAEQQATLATIRSMRDNGQSLRAIADHLNARGVRTNNGGKMFYAQTIKQILAAKIHAGIEA